MEIKRLGDQALVVEFEATISKEIHLEVMSYYHYFQENQETWMTDIIPAYNSLTLVYDPAQISFSEIGDRLSNIRLNKFQPAGFTAHIPVCYELSMDKELFCQSTQLDWEEIIRIHLEEEYLIYMMGFLPGFLYMGDVDKKIQLPRKKEPRKKVEKGAVGIADAQTGIYSMDSPGGWNIIGRTPVSLFDPGASSTFPLEVGDKVLFQRITLNEFNLILHDKKYKIDRVSGGK